MESSLEILAHQCQIEGVWIWLTRSTPQLYSFGYDGREKEAANKDRLKVKNTSTNKDINRNEGNEFKISPQLYTMQFESACI